jgi:hypothetical protein
LGEVLFLKCEQCPVKELILFEFLSETIERLSISAGHRNELAALYCCCRLKNAAE